MLFVLQVHRRVLYDDALGVGEPLNETGSDGHGLIIRGKYFQVCTNPKVKEMHEYCDF